MIVTDWNEIFEYREGMLYWKINPKTKARQGDMAGFISVDTDGYESMVLPAHDLF